MTSLLEDMQSTPQLDGNDLPTITVPKRKLFLVKHP